MGRLMAENRERLATDTAGTAAPTTSSAAEVDPHGTTRGRNHASLKQSSVTATAAAEGTNAAATNSSKKAARIHPIDLQEDTFDPIPPNSLPSFVCDFSLYRVAKSMRLLGYDIRCEPELLGDSIIHCARAERRIVITGSTRMLPKLAKMRRDDIEYRNGRPPPARTVVGYDSDGGSVYETDSDADADEDYTMGYIKVHSSDTHDESMLRVLQTLALPWDESRVFTRCVDCNVLIESVPNKADVKGLVPPGVFEIYANFYHCTCCKKVYWGVDKGVAVNYKSVRTIEYLRQYRGAFANGGRRDEVAEGGVADAGDAQQQSQNYGVEKPVCQAAANIAFAASNATGTGAAVIRSHNGAPIEAMRTGMRNTKYEDFTLRRHFSSLPRSIKQIVFSFMVSADILAVADAIPTVRQLATAASKGEVFIPNMNSRQLKREFRKRQLLAAQQTGQAPFVRGQLKEMMKEGQ